MVLVVIYQVTIGNAPPTITITSPDEQVVISEKDDIAFIGSEVNSWNWEQHSVGLQYQSQLTHKVVESLVNNGDCELTDFNESTQIHTLLLTYFIHQMNYNQKENVQLCNIT